MVSLLQLIQPLSVLGIAEFIRGLLAGLVTALLAVIAVLAALLDDVATGVPFPCQVDGNKAPITYNCLSRGGNPAIFGFSSEATGGWADMWNIYIKLVALVLVLLILFAFVSKIAEVFGLGIDKYTGGAGIGDAFKYGFYAVAWWIGATFFMLSIAALANIVSDLPRVLQVDMTSNNSSSAAQPNDVFGGDAKQLNNEGDLQNVDTSSLLEKTAEKIDQVGPSEALLMIVTFIIVFFAMLGLFLFWMIRLVIIVISVPIIPLMYPLKLLDIKFLSSLESYAGVVMNVFILMTFISVIAGIIDSFMFVLVDLTSNSIGVSPLQVYSDTGPVYGSSANNYSDVQRLKFKIGGMLTIVMISFAPIISFGVPLLLFKYMGVGPDSGVNRVTERVLKEDMTSDMESGEDSMLKNDAFDLEDKYKGVGDKLEDAKQGDLKDSLVEDAYEYDPIRDATSAVRDVRDADDSFEAAKDKLNDAAEDKYRDMIDADRKDFDNKLSMMGLDNDDIEEYRDDIVAESISTSQAMDKLSDSELEQVKEKYDDPDVHDMVNEFGAEKFIDGDLEPNEDMVKSVATTRSIEDDSSFVRSANSGVSYQKEAEREVDRRFAESMAKESEEFVENVDDEDKMDYARDSYSEKVAESLTGENEFGDLRTLVKHIDGVDPNEFESEEEVIKSIFSDSNMTKEEIYKKASGKDGLAPIDEELINSMEKGELIDHLDEKPQYEMDFESWDLQDAVRDKVDAEGVMEDMYKSGLAVTESHLEDMLEKQVETLENNMEDIEAWMSEELDREVTVDEISEIEERQDKLKDLVKMANERQEEVMRDAVSSAEDNLSVFADAFEDRLDQLDVSQDDIGEEEIQSILDDVGLEEARDQLIEEEISKVENSMESIVENLDEELRDSGLTDKIDPNVEEVFEGIDSVDISDVVNEIGVDKVEEAIGEDINFDITDESAIAALGALEERGLDDVDPDELEDADRVELGELLFGEGGLDKNEVLEDEE